MRLDISFAAFFAEDVNVQVRWYTKNAGEEIASKYATQVDRTVEFLADHPNLGKRCDFPEAEFTALRFYPLSRPFQRHLVFYYVQVQTLFAFRVIDGARDLPKRLHDPPGVE